MSFLRHGESIAPMTFIPTGSKQAGSLPVLIGRDEFQPAIPWQVALQQSLPPLRRPRTILQNETSPYNDLSANGDIPLNSVSHLKGALHKRRPLLRTSSPLNPRINRELTLRLVQQTGALHRHKCT
jgi:hypothetical protein